MAKTASNLNAIRSIYLQHGVTDELTMVRDLAEVLAGLYGKGIDETFRRPLAQPDLQHVTDLLRVCVEDIKGQAGALLERHILVYFRSQRSLGVTSTPPHVMDLMIDLTKPSSGDRVLVPNCGAGGFLLRASRRGADCTGYEQSPDWRRIAEVLFQLNHAGNIAVRPEPSHLRGPVDVVLADATGLAGGRAKANAFDIVESALQHLNPGGRAALLVDGDVFAPGRRSGRTLVDALRATGLRMVAKLPPHAAQPYAAATPYLLYIDGALSEHRVWMVETQTDGYPARANRDITRRPSGVSDLTLLPGLLVPANSPELIPITNDVPGQVAFAEMRVYRRTKLGGYVVVPFNGCSLTQVEKVQLEGQPGFIARFETESGIFWGGFMSGEATVLTTERDELFTGAEAVGAPYTVSEQINPCFFDKHGTLLGVELQEYVRELSALRPENYLVTGASVSSGQEALRVLAGIRERQSQALVRLDRLMALLELPISSAIDTTAVVEEPPADLAAEQSALWHAIVSTADDVNERHVTVKVLAARTGLSERFVVTNLELFAKLGLIVAVSVDGIPCYRLPTQQENPRGARKARGDLA